MGLQRVRRLRDWVCKQHISTGPFGKFTIKKLNDSLRLSCLKLMVRITNNLVKNCRTEISLTYDPNIEVFSRRPKLMDTLFIKLSKPCLRFFLSCFVFHIWQQSNLDIHCATVYNQETFANLKASYSPLQKMPKIVISALKDKEDVKFCFFPPRL